MTQIITDWNARAIEILTAQTIQPVVLETNLRRLRKFDACGQIEEHGSYNKLVKFLGVDWKDEQSINLLQILESNGLEDAIWAFRTVADTDTANRVARLLACDCAEMVLPIFEAGQPNDNRPRDCILVARAFATAAASNEQLTAAFDAAFNAAFDTARDAARAAATAAARAASTAAATDASRAAALTAVTAAATAAARTAVRAASTAASRAAATTAALAAVTAAATAAASQLFAARLTHRESTSI